MKKVKNAEGVEVDADDCSLQEDKILVAKPSISEKTKAAIKGLKAKFPSESADKTANPAQPASPAAAGGNIRKDIVILGALCLRCIDDEGVSRPYKGCEHSFCKECVRAMKAETCPTCAKLEKDRANSSANPALPIRPAAAGGG